MASEDDETNPPGEEGTESTGKESFFIPALIGVVALVGVGGSAVVFDAPGKVQAFRAAQAEKAAEKEAEKKAKRDIVTFEPFVISLPQSGQIRRKLPRLSISIALEVSNKEDAQELKTQLRNDFIDALRSIDTTTLRSPDGLNAVRDSLAERSQAVLGDDFHQVLITEFMIL